MSKAEYVDRASAECDENWERIREVLATRYGGAHRGGRFNQASQDSFLPTLQIQFDDLSYLDAPDGDKDTVEAMLTELQLAVWKGEEERMSSQAQFVELFSPFSQMAHEYGIPRCVISPTSFPP